MTLVNDYYAEMYQTHIVGDADVEVHPQYARQACNNNFLNVSVGYVKVYYKQYDAFISYTGNGGGAEIRIGVAYGSLDGTTVTSFEREVEVYVSRSAARNARWVVSWQEIVGSWAPSYPRLLFGVYERDKTDDKKNFSGTLEYINPQGQTITSTYSINVRTKNGPISHERTFYSHLNALYTQFGHLQSYILGYAPAFGGTLDQSTWYSLPGTCW